MIVEMGKEYRLANGTPYRLFCTDGGGSGFATSDHECCADPLYMISDRDGARAIRNGADFVPAAAIRKGDGE